MIITLLYIQSIFQLNISLVIQPFVYIRLIQRFKKVRNRWSVIGRRQTALIAESFT